MPSPDTGNPGSLVPPVDPEVAQDADPADPGEVEAVKTFQRQNLTGRYGSQPVQPLVNKPPTKAEEEETDPAKKKSWIEIKLVDQAGDPVPGEPFTCKTSDGKTVSGTTDDKGFARVNGIEPGNCDITFPNLDKSVIEPK
jgi:hypothetical protein